MRDNLHRSGKLVALTFALGAFAALAVGTPSEARAGLTLRIDRIFGEDFVKTGEIKIYADIVDVDAGEVVEGLEGEKVKVLLDGVVVPGTVSVETFSDAKESVAVAILMAGHRDYNTIGDEGDEGGSTTPNIFGLQKSGFKNFIARLDSTDKVAVWLYTEKELKLVSPWADAGETVAERVEENATVPDYGSGVELAAPSLYRRIADVLKKMGEKDNLPDRKILFLMSDGYDRRLTKKGGAERSVKRTVTGATELGIKVYVIGFSMSGSNALVYLAQLASGTDGLYRKIPEDKFEDIPTAIENVATQIKKQYVITFKPGEDYDGSEQPVKLRMELEAPDGSELAADYEQPIKIGEKAFDWKGLLIWIGIGLGSLLGLIIIWKIIAGIFRRRGERVEYVEEDEDYVGPYKGKLTVTTGPLAGEEFFLIEDVTTIGSIEGNDVVLPLPGVSKRHAGIKIEEMRFELADFGSTNGTRVNGQKVEKQFLRAGDIVAIGECELKFTLK